jgi:4-oxalmesaconate hydratase
VVNPETNDHADNTRRYVDGSSLSDADKARVFRDNAKRVYPKAARWLKA